MVKFDLYRTNMYQKVRFMTLYRMNKCKALALLCYNISKVITLLCPFKVT